MIGIPHQDEEVSNFFSAYSSFKSPEPEGLEDVEPEEYKEEKRKSKGIEYLPGEKLLIKLGKQKKKKKCKPDVEKISESLTRVLNFC